MKNNNLPISSLILSILIFGIVSISLCEKIEYTGIYSVDSIEDGIITLIREDGIQILLNAVEYPQITEGSIIDTEYRIDINATAELYNRIVTLQNTLIERTVTE